MKQLPLNTTLGETTVEDVIHVFPPVPGGLLVSWKTAKKLKILPEEYPQQIQNTRKSLQKRTLAKKTLSISFRLSRQTMEGEKFRIKLTDNEQLFCFITLRFIPFAFRDKPKEKIALLEAQGVIKAVTEPTEWGAPIVVTP